MEAIDIILGVELMVLVLILTWHSVKIISRCQTLEAIADSVMSGKDELDLLLRRFDSLLTGMEADYNECSALKSHIRSLKGLVSELESKRSEIEADNSSVERIRAALSKYNVSLANKASELHDEIRQDDHTIKDMEKQIECLKRTREGLEIAVNNIPVEEVHFLSNPILSLGIIPSVRRCIEAHGISYVGELIHVDEHYLLDITGIGQVTLEKIKARLKENGVWFGMDVIRVGNHWYRRKQEHTTTD